MAIYTERSKMTHLAVPYDSPKRKRAGDLPPLAGVSGFSQDQPRAV